MNLVAWTLVFCVLMYEPVTEACPNTCVCGRTYICTGMTVDCTFRGFTEKPTYIPTDTCLLRLNSNKITTIQNNTFDGFQNLKILWLSSNRISIIQNNVFNGLPNLLELSLHSNKITTIQNNTFNGLQNLQQL
ncbi:leucine-rich repeat-containing protein 3B-like [Saccostrea cucullata]|uniref:leucine-rich repeat-containing protein 3B-like n=1 Tax=Saccostrea cuccullata TaxID=36930 RepID=UPI002ED4E286